MAQQSAFIQIIFMLLLPILETISFLAVSNGTQNYSNYHTLAMTYHDQLPNLLYILYGISHNPSDLMNPYAGYMLQTWDTDNGTVLANNTNLYTACVVACQIEVSGQLFLFESGLNVSIYTMSADNTSISSVNITLIKPAHQWNNSFLIRYADIYQDRVVYCDGHKIGFYSLGGLSNQLFLSSNVTIMNVLLTNVSFQFLISNGTTFEIMTNSLNLIYNHTISFNSTLNSTYLRQMAFTIPPNSTQARFYRGNALFNINSESIYFYNVDSNITKIKQNTTAFTIIGSWLYGGNVLDIIAENGYQVYIYGSSKTIYIGSYNNQNSLINMYLDINETRLLIVVSNPGLSLRLAAHTSGSTTSIKQYQLVEACPSNSPLYATSFCNCSNYTGPYCNQPSINATNANATNTTNKAQIGSTTSSFSMLTIIGIAMGVVAIVILIISGRVIYVKCIKNRGKAVRIPYKYNPVDLVSFQA